VRVVTHVRLVTLARGVGLRNYRLHGEISDDLGKAAKRLDAAATALGQAFGDLMAASAHMTEKQRKDAEFDLPPSS
jgi:hypothetical protein